MSNYYFSAIISTGESIFGGTSLYFDGDNYIYAQGSDEFNFTNKNFNIEMWIKPDGTNPSNGTTGSYAVLATTAAPTDNRGFLLAINPNYTIHWAVGNAGTAWSYSATSVGPVFPNKWSHIALTRENDIVALYINGDLINFRNVSGLSLNNPNNQIQIGGRALQNQYYEGYIDELRITTGISRYSLMDTSYQFYTNEDPYYNDTTLLLDYENNEVSDISLKANQCSITGDAFISDLQKFLGKPSIILGEQTGYITINSGASSFNFGTGDFTIESWIHPINNSNLSYIPIIETRNDVSSTASFTLGLNRLTTSSYFLDFVPRGGSQEQLYSNSIVPLNTWSFITLTRKNGTCNMYINGLKQENSIVLNTAVGSEIDSPIIGFSKDQNYFDGYINDFRITKACRYTQSFDYPRASLFKSNVIDPYYKNTSLMLKMDLQESGQNRILVDESFYNQRISGSGLFNITQSGTKFGNGCLEFSAGTGVAIQSGGYISIPNTGLFDFQDQDFTIEFWYKRKSGIITGSEEASSCCPGWYGRFYTTYCSGGGYSDTKDSMINNGGINILMEKNSTTGSVYFRNNGNNNFISGNLNVGFIPEDWTYYTLMRKSDTIAMFKNGELADAINVSNKSIFSNLTGDIISPTVNIGGTTEGYHSLNGFIDSFRITKGYARYLSMFTGVTGIQKNDFTTLSNLDEYYDYEVIKLKNIFDKNDVKPASISNNGAGYFSGNAYLEISGNSGFNFSGKNFTIEFWIKNLNSGTSGNILLSSTGISLAPINIFLSGNNRLYSNFSFSGDKWDISFNLGLLQSEVWNHYAITRNSGTFFAYKNGSNVATRSGINAPLPWIENDSIIIGNNENDKNINFLIDEFCISKTCKYVSSFIPKTKIEYPNDDKLFYQNVLAIPFNGDDDSKNIQDISIQNSNILNNNVKISNNVKLIKSVYTQSIDSLNRNLFDFWTLNEINGSRYGRNGITLTDRNNNVNSEAGRISNAARFNGLTTQTLFSPVVCPVGGSSQFTLSFWINYPSFVNPGSRTITFNPNESSEWGIVQSATSMAIFNNFGVSTAAMSTSNSSEMFTAGVWNHVVVTKSSSNAWAYYKNGVLQLTNSNYSWFTQTNAAIFIGQNIYNFKNDGPPNGLIDAVGLWTRVLTQQEISQLYNGGAGTETFGSNNFSYANYSEKIAIKSNDSATIETWFNPSLSAATSGTIFSKGMSGNFTENGGSDYYLQIRNSGLDFYVLNFSSGTPLLRTSGILSNEWYHAAIVKDESSSRLYLNGLEKSSNANNSWSATGTGTLYIGTNYNNAYNPEISIENFVVTKESKYKNNFNISRPINESYNDKPINFDKYSDKTILYIDDDSFDNDTRIVDKSIKNWQIQNINSVQVTAQTSPFNYRALAFNGTNNYLTIPKSSKSVQNILLLHMDGTNGSQNITDSSINQFEIIDNGNAQLSTAIKKFGTASCLLDGNESYLEINTNNDTLAANTFNFFASDFTVELWVYRTGSTTMTGIISTRNSNVFSPWELMYFSNGTIALYVRSGASTWYGNGWTSNQTIPLNQWVHIAWVCRAGIHSIFQNGILTLSNINAPLLQQYSQPSNIFIGKGGNAGTFAAYIDEVSITKGLAKYSSNFTPPDAPFSDPSANYGSNVSLYLRMNDDRFTDASSNNFTIKQIGNITVSTSVVKNRTSSAFFDGTGDYLELADNDAFEFGSGDFTIECWFNTSSLKGYQAILSKSHSTSDANGWVLTFETNNEIHFYAGNGGSWSVILDSNFAPLINTWYHLAVTRSGNAWRLFIDGDLKASTTNSFSLPSGTLPLFIGWFPYFANLPVSQTRAFGGYMDDVRITKGLARYTANFTPPAAELPTTTDPNYNNVSLLLRTSKPFVDSSNNNFPITTFGNARILTNITKNGNGAGYFDGNGDYLSIAHNSALNLSSGDFTIEGWIYWMDADNAGTIINKDGVGGSTLPSYAVGVGGGFGTNKLGFGIGSGNSIAYFQVIQDPNDLPKNTWVHFAAVKNGSTITLYKNGVSVASATQTGTIIDGGKPLIIGYEISQASSAYFTGYIDDLRIIKGYALYTSNFTPDTAKYGQLVTTINELEAEFDIVNDDFTIECWIYPTALGSNSYILRNRHLGGFTSGGWLLTKDTDDRILFQYANGSSEILIKSTHIISINKWQHVQVSKINNVIYLLIDGVLSQSRAMNETPIAGNDSLFIGTDPSNISTRTWRGLIKGIKIIKGASKYTPKFNIPNLGFLHTQKSDPHFNNVSLLMYGNGANGTQRILDDSRFNISRLGNGCAYFSGNNTFITVPSSSIANFGTGNFTTEMWIKPMFLPSAGNFIGLLNKTSASNSNNSWRLYLSGLNGNPTFEYTTDGVSNNKFIQGPPVNIYQWNHIAAVRSGEQLTVYSNGVSGATVNVGADNIFPNNLKMEIGKFEQSTTNGIYNGFMEDLRITDNVPRYYGNFSGNLPDKFGDSQLEDPNYNDVELLLHMNGYHNSLYIKDSSINNYIVSGNNMLTVLNNEIFANGSTITNSSSQSIFGGAAIRGAGGSTSFLSIPSRYDFGNIGTSDFTIEWWDYISGWNNGYFPVIHYGNDGDYANAQSRLGIYYSSTGANLTVSMLGNSQNFPVFLTGTASLNSGWKHNAITRRNGIVNLFVNGKKHPSGYLMDYDIARGVNISTVAAGKYGAGFGTLYSMNGYIDDLRFTKNVARYIEDFDPPTEQFANF